MADQHHHRQTNHSPDDDIMHSSKYPFDEFHQFQKNNFHLCYCLCCHFMLSPAQPSPNHSKYLQSSFPNTSNSHLKTTKTIIKGNPLNINVLIKMLELAKAMERNIPVLLMWRRPYGCIYIAHLVHLLICNFFAFSQEIFGILDFHIPRVHFTPVSNLWKNATRFKQNYWITDSMLQLLNECSAVNRENVGRK